ncbi:putative metal-binding motif-containing protein [Candidatus Peregrinibacteria bacterium]|nr:putative metal-binding motif-containing protein [Candidatus Peregrinibacteria bacterium]
MNSIANSGITDFSNTSDSKDITISGKKIRSGILLSSADRACAEKQIDANGQFSGYKLKGIEWNDNLGPISFACEDGLNRIHTCYKDEPAHQVIIDKNGAFSGQTWSPQIGLINSSGTAGDSSIPFQLRLALSKIGADSYAPIGGGGGQWAWSDRVGWIDFSGVSFPWTGAAEQHDIDNDGYCAIGDGAAVCFAPPKKGSGDCNDNIAAINPGAADPCGDGIDQNCDGQDACGGGTDTDSDGVSPPFDCDDNDPNIYPGAPEDMCATVDMNCDGKIPEPCVTLSGTYICAEQQSSGNIKSQETAQATFSDNKKIILRNVEKVKATIGVDYNPPNFDSDQQQIFYYENSITIAPTGDLTKKQTIIVEGGDIYIDTNITGEQIGLIALKNEFGSGGKIYIKNTVTNIKAQIFADDGVYSYKNTSTPLDINNGDLYRQLVIEGTISSANNTREVPNAGDYAPASFSCLRTIKTPGPSNDIPTATATPAKPKNKAVFLDYTAPSPDLPVFSGFSGMGVSQGN